MNIVQKYSLSVFSLKCISLFLIVTLAPAVQGVPLLNLANLTLLKWTDENDKSQTLRIREEISSKWTEAGDLLGVSSSRLDAIGDCRRGDTVMCSRDVLQEWIRTNGGPGSYSVTWDGIVSLLKDMQLTNVADILKNALQLKSF